MFKYVILLASILLAGCAAWFSVTGISQLFIGAHIAAIIMAASLELGKIVGISFLYRYWSNIPKFLKTYMGIGGITLMLITSLGIYGYLSSAYAGAAASYEAQSSQVSQISNKVNSLNTSIQRYTDRMSQLQQYRSDQESRLNQLVGKTGFLTQQSMVRRSELDISKNQRVIDSLITIRDSLQTEHVVQTGNLSTETKLGTFSYVAKSLGIPLDTVVKWFVLLIIFVFDPMAIALIISYNFLIKNQNLFTTHIKPDLPVDPSMPDPIPQESTQVDPGLTHSEIGESSIPLEPMDVKTDSLLVPNLDDARKKYTILPDGQIRYE